MAKVTFVQSLTNNKAVAVVTAAAAALVTYLGRNVAPFVGSSVASGAIFGLVATKSADVAEYALRQTSDFFKDGKVASGKEEGKLIPNHYRFVAKHLIGGLAAFGVTYGLAAAGLIAGVPVANAVALTALAMVLAKGVPPVKAQVESLYTSFTAGEKNGSKKKAAT